MFSDRKGVLWTTVGNIGYTAFYFLAIFLLVRLEGAGGLGSFLLAQSFAIPLSILCGLRYREILGSEPQLTVIRPHYVSVAVITVPLTVFVIFIWYFIADASIFLYGSLVILTGSLRGVSSVAQGRFYRLRQFKLAGIFEFFRGLSVLLSFFVGIVLYGSVVVAVAVWVGFWTVVQIVEVRYALVVSVVSVGSHPESELGLAKKFRFAVSESLTMVQISSIRVVVGIVLGEVALGILGAASILIKGIEPVGRALSVTLLPKLGDAAYLGNLSVAESHVKKNVLATSFLAIIFSVIGFFFVPTIVEVLLGEALRPPSIVSAIIMAGSAPLITATFNTQIFTSYRLLGMVEKVSWLSLLLSLGTGVLLIPAMGLVGAALSLSVGYFLRFFLAYLYLIHYFKGRHSYTLD